MEKWVWIVFFLFDVIILDVNGVFLEEDMGGMFVL